MIRATRKILLTAARSNQPSKANWLNVGVQNRDDMKPFLMRHCWAIVLAVLQSVIFVAVGVSEHRRNLRYNRDCRATVPSIEGDGTTGTSVLLLHCLLTL